MPNHEGASAIAVQRGKDGSAWISADSLVDLFEDMANGLTDGPAKNTLTTLANSLRPMTTYAEMDPGPDDNSIMVGRRCPTCRTGIIDGQTISGTPVTVDAEPVPNGTLFPLRIAKGVPTLAPWRPGLDGIGTVRLAEHACGGQ